jgi:hypothetical protein
MQITFHQIPSPVDPELSSRGQTSFDKHVTQVRDPFSVTLNQTSIEDRLHECVALFLRRASSTHHGMFERVGTRFPSDAVKTDGTERSKS